MNSIPIVYITDSNFIPQTATSITSLIKNKNKNTKYTIYIIATEIDENTITKLNKINNKDCIIKIISGDMQKFAGLHNFEKEGYLSATEAALLKFDIPELLPEIDKIIYLDGDTIILNDLSELFNIDIGDNYVGAAHDTGKLYFKHKYVLEFPNYFNSGVMLLNLKQMRLDSITDKLIETKRYMNDKKLMDQNVFNKVFCNRLTIIDIKWNLLIVNLERAKLKWDINEINKLFNSNYKDFKDLKNNAAIIHFSSKDKPWIYKNIPYGKVWLKYFYLSPFKEKTLNLKTLETFNTKKLSILEYVFSIRNEYNFYKTICFLGVKIKFKNKYKFLEFEMANIKNNINLIKQDAKKVEKNINYQIDKLTWHNCYDKKELTNLKKNDIKVSVIIPVHNAQNFLNNCLDSIINQTLTDIEIICIDDGSTDNSLEILKEYKNTTTNLHVVHQTQQRQGSARNKGLEIAQGEYITFVDSDDYIEPNFLKELYTTMEQENPDIVICNIQNYCKDKKLKPRVEYYQSIYENYFTKNNSNKKIKITNDNFLSFRVGPVAKLYKKEIIDKYKLRFPEQLIQEDEAFYWYYMTKIQTAYLLDNKLYNRLIHENSVMYQKEILKQNLNDHLFICKQIFDHLKKLDLYPIYEETFIQYYQNVKNKTIKTAQNNQCVEITEKIVQEIDNYINNTGIQKQSFKRDLEIY